MSIFSQILSRGQLIKYHRFVDHNHYELAHNVQITKEMLPSFRIIAYYHTSSNEVVSDSLWLDVEDTCMGKVRDDEEIDKQKMVTQNDNVISMCRIIC